MTEKRFIMAEPMVTIKDLYFVRDKEQEAYLSISKGIDLLNIQSEYVTKCAKEKAQLIDALNQRTEQCNKLYEENEQLKQQIKDMSRFKHTGEHIRLSINIETGELQRHIYATGQLFGDFDRVLVTNWLDEKTYQKFIDRIIEVYNTEFKGDME